MLCAQPTHHHYQHGPRALRYEKMMAKDRSYLEKTVEIFLDDLFRVLRSGVRAYRNGVLIRVFFNVLGEAEKRVML